MHKDKQIQSKYYERGNASRKSYPGVEDAQVKLFVKSCIMEILYRYIFLNTRTQEWRRTIYIYIQNFKSFFYMHCFYDNVRKMGL